MRSVSLAAVLLGTLPATAGEFGAGSHIAGVGPDPAHDADMFQRRGLGRDDHRRSGRADEDDRRAGLGGHSP